MEYQVIVALFIAVLNEKATWRMEFVQRNENLLRLTVLGHIFEGTC